MYKNFIAKKKKYLLFALSVIANMFFCCINTINTNATGDRKVYIRVGLGSAIPASEIQTDDDGGNKVGYMLSDKLRSSFAGSLAFGYQFNSKIALEAEFSDLGKLRQKVQNTTTEFRETTQTNRLVYVNDLATIDKFHVQPKLFMANIRYTPYNAKLAPYIVAGLGLANIKSSDYITSRVSTPSDYYRTKGATKRNLAYSVGGGLSLSLDDNLKLDWQYKFAGLGSFHNRSTTIYWSEGKQEIKDHILRSRLNVHTLSVGMSYGISPVMRVHKHDKWDNTKNQTRVRKDYSRNRRPIHTPPVFYGVSPVMQVHKHKKLNNSRNQTKVRKNYSGKSSKRGLRYHL